MSQHPPEPRPALVRASDGTVQPAAGYPSSLMVDEAALAKSAKKQKKKGKDKAADDVELVVRLSKRDRKRLRRKAESYGWTADVAAAHILRTWADT